MPSTARRSSSGRSNSCTTAASGRSPTADIPRRARRRQGSLPGGRANFPGASPGRSGKSPIPRHFSPGTAPAERGSPDVNDRTGPQGAPEVQHDDDGPLVRLGDPRTARSGTEGDRPGRGQGRGGVGCRGGGEPAGSRRLLLRNGWAPTWPPKPPNARSTPAKPWRSSITRQAPSTTVLQSISRSPADVHTSDRAAVAAALDRGVR